MEPAIYELNRVSSDDARFEGFAWEDDTSILGTDYLDEDFYPAHSGKWNVPTFGRKWKRVAVRGNVRPFNDFPGAMSTPVFSRRAVDVLAGFLRPNGELLPLVSDVGEYFAYNVQTVADIIDRKKSTVTKWTSRQVAQHVAHLVLKKKTLGDLSIFYLREKPECPVVTHRFVERAWEHGLNGFEFRKMWPLPEGTNWRMEHVMAHRGRRKIKPEGTAAELKANSLVLFLPLAGKSPNAKEKQQISLLLKDLDAQLIVQSEEAPYFGRMEGHDIVDGDCRIFLSCPDAIRLREKLDFWLSYFVWPRAVWVVTRNCRVNEDATEEQWEEFS